MKTLRYRLPEVLGGQAFDGEPTADGREVVMLIHGARIVFPADAVTLDRPAEPVAGWVVVAEPVKHDQPQVFHREPAWTEGVWWWHDENRECLWDEVCTVGDPVLLVLQHARRGRCRGCGEVRTVRLDGKVMQHGSRHKPCRGSDQFPADEMEAV